MQNSLKSPEKVRRYLAKYGVVKTQKQIPRKTPNNLLSFSDSINWLKRRYSKTAKKKYLLTKLEMEQENEVKEVFEKIDFDKSGKIDVKEMKLMFESNGIDLTR